MSNLRISYAAPRSDAFKALRDDCGWGDITRAQAQLALTRSLMTAACYEGDTLVGFARLVGDGVLNIYVQDVIVTPLARGRGIGRMVLRALISKATDHYDGAATLGLMAASGKRDFYARQGFRVRPNNAQGPGMSATCSQLKQTKQQW